MSDAGKMPPSFFVLWLKKTEFYGVGGELPPCTCPIVITARGYNQPDSIASALPFWSPAVCTRTACVPCWKCNNTSGAGGRWGESKRWRGPQGNQGFLSLPCPLNVFSSLVTRLWHILQSTLCFPSRHRNRTGESGFLIIFPPF